MGKGSKAVTKKPAVTSESSEEDTPTKTPTKTSYSSGQSQTSVYRYGDIKFSNVDVSPLAKVGKQEMSYINYHDSKKNADTKILVQSDKIKLTTHGIPSLDKEGSKTDFYSDDSKREFIKIPLDDQPGAKALRAHLEEADSFFGSTELRKQLFGQKAKDHVYQSCIRTPQRKDDDKNSDDDEGSEDDKSKKNKKGGKGKKVDDKEKKPVVDYVKMKFNMVPTGDGKNKVFTNKTKLKKIVGGGKEIIIANTITDIANEIRWNSEIKFIFYYTKVWVGNPGIGTKTRPYGVGFKIMAIEYTPSIGKGLNADEIDFLSEEDEENDTKVTTKDKPSKKVQKLDDDDDENDDEEEEEPKNLKDKPKAKKPPLDDDEEEEIEVEDEPKKSKEKPKNNKKATKDEDEEEEEEEEEEEIPIKKGGKKPTGKKPSKNNDDEDDEDDEPDESSKKNTKKGSSKKPSKKASRDEDDDEEEEEEIKPKPSKKTSGRSR